MPIEYTREGNVGYITLNRPPANSYDADGLDDLARAIDAAAADTGARAVVLRSAIERFFCAGADVRYLTEASIEDNLDLIDRAHATLSQIARVPKPFIALIQGHALGGGLEIALACDLRFGADGKYAIGLPEAGLGLIPGNGGTQRLARLIGPTKALDLMFTAKRLTPEEAHQLGILGRLFPAEEAAQRTHEYAEALANGASFAIGSIKQAVWQGVELSLHDGLKLEKSLVEPVLRGAEIQEGVQAFREKRKPVFHQGDEVTG
jgi:enoyl-CoA hydratase/carnithine racemase